MRTETGIRVDRGRRKGFRFDAIVRLFSTAAYAAFCKGPSTIKDCPLQPRKATAERPSPPIRQGRDPGRPECGGRHQHHLPRPHPAGHIGRPWRPPHGHGRSGSRPRRSPHGHHWGRSRRKELPAFFDDLSEVGATFGRVESDRNSACCLPTLTPRPRIVRPIRDVLAAVRAWSRAFRYMGQAGLNRYHFIGPAALAAISLVGWGFTGWVADEIRAAVLQGMTAIGLDPNTLSSSPGACGPMCCSGAPRNWTGCWNGASACWSCG